LRTFVSLNPSFLISRKYSLEDSMRNYARALLTLIVLVSFVGVPLQGARPNPQDAKKQRSEAKYEQQLAKEVRHQLVMLPYYSVFDNLQYQVQGDKVILSGQVIRPTLKSDAEAAVKSIEGAASVVNNIEVLPPSPMDDQIRRAVYRATSPPNCRAKTILRNSLFRMSRPLFELDGKAGRPTT
jgi:osmotically-inducible protein OsmY